MSLGVASSLISLETFAGRFDESWVDRLNHVWTVVVLVLFAIVVSAEQFLGNPIRCLCPLPKCSVDFMAYANSYCWNRNTYYRVPKDLVPIEDIKQGEIQTTYYQWVPMILLLQALSFRLPNIIWRIYSRTSDIDLNKVVELAEKVSTANLEERQKVVTDLAELMDRWLSNLRHYTFNRATRFKEKASRTFMFCCFCCGKRSGTYLTGLYVTVALWYTANVIVHLAILDSFMTSKGSSMYGIEVLPRLGADDAWHQSPHFPSETLCELHIRHLQNVTTLSLQCVLPINAFSEKVFVFLWFWLLVVAIFTCKNILSWLFLTLLPVRRFVYLKKYLKLNDDLHTAFSKRMLHNFIQQYLRHDGFFVLRIVSRNASDLFVVDLVGRLWQKYKALTQPRLEELDPELPENSV